MIYFTNSKYFSLIVTCIIYYLSSCCQVSALSMTSSYPTPPRGSASKPLDKKKVAIFGAGGYMGSTIFGFIQRASTLYGTGLGGTSSTPRGICATSMGSLSVNKVLTRSFNLAFAGEDMFRLTDMQDVQSIMERLNGMDAVVMGTEYQLERRSVNLNTYEKTPNDKTLEFYLDERYAANPDVEAMNDINVHLTLFRNTIQACKLAGVKHVQIIETPSESASISAEMKRKSFCKILEEGGIPFTYMFTSSKLKSAPDFTFEKGLQSNIAVKGYTLKNMDTNSMSSIQSLIMDESKDSSSSIPREDVAALAVQSLMSLDWSKSRFLNVSCDGMLNESQEQSSSMTKRQKKNLRTDREWCVNSSHLASVLGQIE